MRETTAEYVTVPCPSPIVLGSVLNIIKLGNYMQQLAKHKPIHHQSLMQISTYATDGQTNIRTNERTNMNAKTFYPPAYKYKNAGKVSLYNTPSVIYCTTSRKVDGPIMSTFVMCCIIDL